MKVGWLTPFVVQSDGWYTIPDIETNPVAFVLHDPAHGTHEYWLVENRWIGDSYDNTEQFNGIPESNLVDEGLVVWHIDESRKWAGVNSGGISKVQLVHRDGMPGENTHGIYRNNIAFSADHEDNYNFYDDSYPENTRWWDGNKSHCGIWGVSEARPMIKAYFDVPGPGLFVPDEDLYSAAPPGEPAEYSVELINTGDVIDYVTANVIDLDEDLMCSNSDEILELEPKVPKMFEFNLTKHGNCTVDPQLRNFRVKLQRVSSQLPDYYLQGIFNISGVKPVVTLDPSTRSSYPEKDSNYKATVSNQGNIKGKIGITFEGITNNSLKAYPKAIPNSWVKDLCNFLFNVKTCGTDQRGEYFEIEVPSSWAGMEDSTYEFKIVATAESRPHVSSKVSGWLTVKATPRSQMEYQRIKMLEEIFSSQNQRLIEKIQNAIHKMELAIIKYQIGETRFSKNLLASTIYELRGLKNLIISEKGDGISEDDAANLLRKADEFIAEISSIRRDMPELLASIPHSGYRGIQIYFIAPEWGGPQLIPTLYRWDYDNDGNWDTPYSLERTFHHSWITEYSGDVVVEILKGDNAFTDSAPVLIADTTFVVVLDSTGEPIEGVYVEYFAAGWQAFGTTDNMGKVSMDLVMDTYQFRMGLGGNIFLSSTPGETHAVNLDSNDQDYCCYIEQYVGSQSTVRFVTVEVMVELIDANGCGLEGGVVEYYEGEWRPFGKTGTDGTVMNELLPLSYEFRMTYNGSVQTKTQDVGLDPVVAFDMKIAEAVGGEISPNTITSINSWLLGGISTILVSIGAILIKKRQN
jgi:hypothetical protein